MTQTIKAIFENGVFRPTGPVPLADGSRVSLTVRTDEPPVRNSAAFDVLSRMASLPIEGQSDAFSGEDHDSILYGKNGSE